MATVEIKHGNKFETITPSEANAMLETLYQRDRPVRVRASEVIVLDAAGAGQDEVYTIPPGYEFEARRVMLDMDTASDPANGALSLSQQGHVADWTLVANAAGAANVQATATRAGQAGVAHVLESITATCWQPGAPAAANELIFVVRDGATGVGAILFQGVIKLTTTANDVNTFSQTGLNIVGTAGNAMTVEFLGAPGANAVELISADGFDQYASGTGPVRAIEYLRSGTRIEYGMPQGPTGVQVPGIQTWGAEQGPYLRNGETFEVKIRGLTAQSRFYVTVEGILSRPYTKKP